MKTIQFIMGAAVLVLAVLLLTNHPRRDVPAYDVAREIAVRGVVQDVQEFYCPLTRDQGTHLMLQTEQGALMQVHVAPRRYLRGNSISFTKGDNVDVVGSIVNNGGSPALMARKISRGGETFSFRSTSGKPLWSE